MLEIVIIIVASGKIGETAENKGYSGVLFRVLFVLAWFFGAIFGGTAALLLASGGRGGGGGLCIFFVGYLLGGCLAIGAVTLVVAVLPEPRRERGYMDDYHEFQRTGRVHDYRRDGDYDADEDEEERRPRRRARWAGDEDDRPRRDIRERDDRYREDRDDRRRRDDPDDRPRRRPRRSS